MLYVWPILNPLEKDFIQKLKFFWIHYNLFRVALHSMVHSFIELCKPLSHDKAVIHEGYLVLKCSMMLITMTLLILVL